jgi:hypothetical protein
MARPRSCITEGGVPKAVAGFEDVLYSHSIYGKHVAVLDVDYGVAVRIVDRPDSDGAATLDGVDPANLIVGLHIGDGSREKSSIVKIAEVVQRRRTRNSGDTKQGKTKEEDGCKVHDVCEVCVVLYRTMTIVCCKRAERGKRKAGVDDIFVGKAAKG